MSYRQSKNVANCDQKSVSELRQWLSRFGDENRDHYEKNKVQKNTEGRQVRHRIQQFEHAASSSGSASSTFDKHRETTKKREQQRQQRPTFLEPAFTPVFRDFGKETPILRPRSPPRDDEREEMSVRDLENYRVVAIEKLLTPPRPQNYRYKLESWEAFEGNGDRFSKPSWHPNVLHTYSRSLLDETRTSWSEDEADEPDDELSRVSGAFTDPGGRGVTGSRLGRLLKKSPKASKSPGKLFSKLTLLKCKSVKDREAELFPPTVLDFAGAADAGQLATPEPVKPVEPAPGELSACRLSTNSSPSFRDATLTSGNLDKLYSPEARSPKYQLPSILSEEGTASTWSEESEMPSVSHATVGTNLGEIFAEELELENQRSRSEAGATWSLPPALLTSQSESWTREAKVEKPVTEVSAAIQKFGGRAKNRKSAVQRRKEELQEKFAQSRQPAVNKKVKWQVSNGGYKKKVVLDYS